MNVFELLKKLIDTSSLSGAENRICQIVASVLRNEGFSVKVNKVDENGSNIIVRVGKPKVFLMAHLDTVEPYFPYSETSELIYGRGACDTKGSAASMICAASACLAKNVRDFGLIFTVGEESDFRGVKKLLSSKIEIPFAVVGEPTSLGVVNGHYGYTELKLIANGKAVHTSNPEKGENAIEKLVFAINIIKEKVRPQKGTIMTLVKISGGTATNVVPDLAEALYSFRVSPYDNFDYLQIFKKRVGNLVGVFEGNKLDSVASKVPNHLKFLGKPKITKYCTELSFLGNRGVVIGPGDITVAHANNEFVKKAELEKAVEIYSEIIGSFIK